MSIRNVALVALFAMSAFANAKTVKISGELARDLVDASDTFGATDAGMGHVWAGMFEIVCEKTVTDTDGEIKCTGRPGDKGNAPVTVSSKDESKPDGAAHLRRLLAEVTRADRKVSSTRLVLKVKSFTCDSMSLGHDLDSIDFEPNADCTIQF